MNEAMEQLMKRVEKKFGVALRDHQIERMARALENSKQKLKIDDRTLLNGFHEEDKLIVDTVVNAITIQESYFFRDATLFAYLRNVYFPRLIKEKTDQNNFSIRIWSAGCSRGEEIYSVAILLNEIIVNQEKWRVELIGTDICYPALGDAIDGVYKKLSLRAMSDEMIAQYFTVSNNQYILDPSIKNKVQFSYNNLAEKECLNLQFDLILCRNVFIYLTQDAIENALNKFDASLSKNGKLILGPSDFISFCNNPFVSHIDEGVVYFTKKNAQEERMREPVEKKIAPKIYINEQKKKSKMLADISESLTADPLSTLHLIDEHLSTQSPTALLYQYKAQALLKLNDIDTADEFCDLSLRLNSRSFIVFFMKGLIQYEKGNLPESKNFFNKVLILKKDCIEAYYYLAQIAMHAQDNKKALVLLKQILLLSKDKEKDYKLLFFEGETLSAFIESVKEEIARLISGSHYE